MTTPPTQQNETLRRWRLILGGGGGEGTGCPLSGQDLGLDAALAALYGGCEGPGGQGGANLSERPRYGNQREAGLGASSPSVARWLGDIREYFPSQVVRVMQRDALERLDLHMLLLEPEMLEAVEADVHLVANLLSLKGALPETSKDTARQVVRRVVDELMEKLASPTRQAVSGAVNRAARNNRRPRHAEIDWGRTIRLNLKHYQPEYKTIIPERLVGYGRKRASLQDIVLCVDQSGSMAGSVVYSGIFGAVLASLPAVSTKMVAFDTAVVDLTEELDDPVDLLFGVQLGGGTDIDKALGYCQQIVTRPQQTVLVLVSDLYEGGDERSMLKRAAALVGSGVQMVALLALDDEGAPGFSHSTAEKLAALNVPAFACTPELFPALMAEAINRGDLAQWAGEHDLLTSRSAPA